MMILEVLLTKTLTTWLQHLPSAASDGMQMIFFVLGKCPVRPSFSVHFRYEVGKVMPHFLGPQTLSPQISVAGS